VEEIVELDRQLIENSEFVSDLARFSENLLTEKFIRKKYGNLDEATWTRLGENDELVSAIEDEKLRRIRSGAAKREKAQQHIVRGPDILNDIMLDAKASPKHKIDAAKTLDGFAANDPQAVPPAAAAERFCITINLGADVPPLIFNKSIALGPEPNDINKAPQKLLPANKREDDSNSTGRDTEDDWLSTPWGLVANKQGNDDNGGQPL
jgi:hypothetical protein